MQTQYFAPIDFNMKLQFCAKASFSLLLILLWSQHTLWSLDTADFIFRSSHFPQWEMKNNPTTDENICPSYCLQLKHNDGQSWIHRVHRGFGFLDHFKVPAARRNAVQYFLLHSTSDHWCYVSFEDDVWNGYEIHLAFNVVHLIH